VGLIPALLGHRHGFDELPEVRLAVFLPLQQRQSFDALPHAADPKPVEVVTAFLGVFLLGERLTRIQTTGTVLALTGAMLVSIWSTA
jgi:hypothetical protein